MDKKRIFILLLFVSIFALYFLSSPTYTAYESEVNDQIGIAVAEWKIEIDDQDIARTAENIALSNIVWEGEHTNNNTVAPGSKGVVTINIDPTSTEVAIKYNITYADHLSNPDCLLTVTSIYLENEALEKVNDNTYSGIITLDQIKNKSIKVLKIHVEWVNDEANNEVDTQVGLNESEANYLNLEFMAQQYKGE